MLCHCHGNAPYHNKQLNHLLISNTRKSDTQEWVIQWNIPFNPSLLCPELYKLIKECKPHRCTYHIKHRHTILYIPLYYPDLKLTELIWAIANKSIVAKNTTFKLDDVIHLMKKRYILTTLKDWSSRCHHIIKVDATYFGL